MVNKILRPKRADRFVVKNGLKNQSKKMEKSTQKINQNPTIHNKWDLVTKNVSKIECFFALEGRYTKGLRSLKKVSEMKKQFFFTLKRSVFSILTVKKCVDFDTFCPF